MRASVKSKKVYGKVCYYIQFWKDFSGALDWEKRLDSVKISL